MSIFTKVKLNRVRKNTFSLSHSRKFSMGTGKLVPCMLMECVPNDSITVNTSQLVRASPMVAPVMHRFTFYVHFFFVPNRIVWKEWEKFITGGAEGDEAPSVPSVSLRFVNKGSLADYLGLPTFQLEVDSDSARFNALSFGAYQKIFYEYYRDQNNDDVIEEWLEPGGVVEGLATGDNDVSSDGTYANLLLLRSRAWEHDYFTSALPYMYLIIKVQRWG